MRNFFGLSERVAAFYISTITNKTTADKLAISIIRINAYCCGYKKEPPPHKKWRGAYGGSRQQMGNLA